MLHLPVALQVYSVREDAQKDFAGTMQKIKDMGYQGVELAGLYGLPLTKSAGTWTRSALGGVCDVKMLILLSILKGLLTSMSKYGANMSPSPISRMRGVPAQMASRRFSRRFR